MKINLEIGIWAMSYHAYDDLKIVVINILIYYNFIIYKYYLVTRLKSIAFVLYFI